MQGLHESLGARLGNGAEVVDQISLGHANAGINDGQSVVILVGHDLDVQLLAAVQLGGVRQRLVADLIGGIGKIEEPWIN